VSIVLVNVLARVLVSNSADGIRSHSRSKSEYRNRNCLGGGFGLRRRHDHKDSLSKMR
jgi:hypothetical protein